METNCVKWTALMLDKCLKQQEEPAVSRRRRLSDRASVESVGERGEPPSQCRFSRCGCQSNGCTGWHETPADCGCGTWYGDLGFSGTCGERKSFCARHRRSRPTIRLAEGCFLRPKLTRSEISAPQRSVYSSAQCVPSPARARPPLLRLLVRAIPSEPTGPARACRYYIILQGS